MTSGRPARVLSVTKGLGRGGTERLLVGALRHIDRTRFDVEVAYLLPSKDALVAEIEGQGVPVHCLGAGRAGRLAWIPRLQSLVRAGRFDVVHTHMPSPAVAARLMLWSRPPVLVHTEHNVWERYRWATHWANALTYGRNDLVLAVSQGVAASINSSRLRRHLPPVEVLIHGIDIDGVRRSNGTRRSARAVLGLPEDSQVIGTVGNFTAKKDQATLLRAFALLASKRPQLHLVMLGSGPLEDKLRAQAGDLGLGHRVTWAGSRDDVLELLAAFDVFVLSSQHEGLSIALLEALATGVPCVATGVGGTPEVLEDGKGGFLVPPGQPDRLAAAVGKLVDDPELRAEFGRRAAGIGRQYCLEGAVARLQDAYDEVLGRR